MINRPSSSKPAGSGSRPSTAGLGRPKPTNTTSDTIGVGASIVESASNSILSSSVNNNNLLDPMNNVMNTTANNNNNNNSYINYNNNYNNNNLNTTNITLNNTTLNNNNYTSVQNNNATSSFYVIVNGVISHAEFPGNMNISCSFQFVYGQDWEIARTTGEGVSLESGVTQVAMRPRGFNSKYIFNFPLEISFRSTNPYGWPKLCLVLQEGTGKQKIIGYGWCQVPIGAGKHSLKVKLFKPQSTSLIQKWIGSVKGVAPEYFDSTMVCKGEGREVTRTESVGGEVTVDFNIMHKGMSQFGFEPFVQ